MYGTIKDDFLKDIQEIKSSGLYKDERVLTSKQGPEITTISQEKVLNFCANNYLGLSSHPKVIQAGINALKTHGFGLSSVRFICGTQDIHKELELKIAQFYGTEDTILYAAAFDANGGLFEPLFNAEDAIISDELNHASIIDGVRLCKAQRYRYKHSDMVDLEKQLQLAQDQRFRIIVTDGVFSMDGDIAKLDEIIFEDVYPLFGQSDIKGSSDARNNAIQEDLTTQLTLAINVLIIYRFQLLLFLFYDQNFLFLNSSIFFQTG